MEPFSLDARAASRATEPLPQTDHGDIGRQRLIAGGGVLGMLAVSSCCILPLIFFGLGLSGAWIGNLTALAPYQPLLGAATAGLIGYGFYLVYRKPKQAWVGGDAHTRPVANRIVKFSLWTAAILGTVTFASAYVARWLLGA